jgi:hypothetical protein
VPWVIEPVFVPTGGSFGDSFGGKEGTCLQVNRFRILKEVKSVEKNI